MEIRKMKYLLLIYMTDDAMSEAERAACYSDSAKLCHDLNASGNFLAPIRCTRQRRPGACGRDGRTIVTDGPFAETREHLGGYFSSKRKRSKKRFRLRHASPKVKDGRDSAGHGDPGSAG
jgi:hypothetical protein